MLVLVTGHAFVKRKEWSGVTLKIQTIFIMQTAYYLGTISEML